MIGSFPLIIRPAFTLGGTGGGIAYNMEEFEEIVKSGLDASMTNQVRGPVSICRPSLCNAPADVLTPCDRYISPEGQFF